MKQAEHPPVTAGANSAAEYSLALIDQLARIDRTCSKEEMDELVCRLLSLIGEAMLSGRVFSSSGWRGRRRPIATPLSGARTASRRRSTT